MRLKQEQRMQHNVMACVLAAALLFRIPRQVTEVQVYARGGAYPVCPTCSASLDREYTSFCDRCGQRLSWDEYERGDVKERTILFRNTAI